MCVPIGRLKNQRDAQKVVEQDPNSSSLLKQQCFINTAQSLETSYSHPVDFEWDTRNRDMTFLTGRIKYLSVADRNSEDIHTES